MKSMTVKRSLMLIVSLIMAVTLLLPACVSAQGRGHGRGLSKKSEKFVNGHDARDGRWDGRGPRPRFFRGRWYYDRQHRHKRWLKLRHKKIHRVYVR
jgi:hypothetical protein